MNMCRMGRWGAACLGAALLMGWTGILSAGPLFDEGTSLHGKKAYKEAAKVLNRSVDQEEGSGEPATLLLSDCYLELKKESKAIATLKHGATRFPDSWEIHYRLGDLQEKSGDNFGALSAFTRAAELKPEDLTTAYRLGMAYDGTAQMEKALEVYRTLHHAGSPLATKLLHAIQGME